MRKTMLLCLMIFAVAKTYSQNYNISFAASGAASSVDSVKVENLNQGTTLTMSGNDILHLFGTVGISDRTIINGTVKVYPNPMQGQAVISFYAYDAGFCQVFIYDINTKVVAKTSSIVIQGMQKYLIEGLQQGMYFIKITGDHYTYTTKLISQSVDHNEARLTYLGSENLPLNQTKLKNTNATIDMAYTIGDRLLFKGKYGIYSTIVMDVPTTDKTITFDFVPCTDYDNNNYTVVQIGSQLWMAENLKTTKYRNGDIIPNLTDNASWASTDTGAYCNYNNLISNAEVYGKLYNWYAVVSTANLCPVGWKTPSNAEWKTMTNYLGGDNIAGSKLKETGNLHWHLPNNSSNESGFTALPGSLRNDNGSFQSIGYSGSWWNTTAYTTTNANYIYMGNNLYGVYYSILNKNYGNAVRCLKDTTSLANLPVVITAVTSYITDISAVSGGNVVSDGGFTVISRGVCFNTSVNPTTANSSVTNGSGTGVFVCNLIGLNTNTVYYLKAFAENSVGIAYGAQKSFLTTDLINGGSQVYDIDGNAYDTIHVGTKVWLRQNLKTTKQNTGNAIPNVTDSIAWRELVTGAYCWYNNDSATFKDVYGALYNQYAMFNNKLCPLAWHVSTNAEWIAMNSYLGGNSIAGGKLKETGIVHWNTPNAGATDEIAFTALPGGIRQYNGPFNPATFADINNFGYFWTTTPGYTNCFYYWVLRYAVTNAFNYSADPLNGLSVRCVRDANTLAVLPAVTTGGITAITATSAISGGNVIYDGGAAVLARGVCYGIFPNPTISCSNVSSGQDTGVFVSSLTDLTPNTVYYLKSYVTNVIGTSYGNEISFSTLTGPVVFDIDGNGYDTVHLGTQIWMMQNLKTTRYRNGNPIANVTSDGQWSTLASGAYCWYNNDSAAYKNVYGGLYNWFTVNTGNLCPADWHVPANAEWDTLENYLGGYILAGGKLKESGLLHWTYPNTGATNVTGFTALPGGERNVSGPFTDIGEKASLWSVSQYNSYFAYARFMYYNYSYNNYSTYPKQNGLSVRCIKN